MRIVLALALAAVSVACSSGSNGSPSEPTPTPTPTPEPEAAATSVIDAAPAPVPDATPLESVRPGVNDKFLDPELDVDSWVKRFEVESREVYSARAQILSHLDLRPGMAIADIGAGTGLFVPLFAKAVGTEGAVYAVDISPSFLAHLRERVAEEKLEHVSVVEGSDRSIELKPGSVDVVFICDTYHHFEYPSATLASIRDALEPGGVLFIIDFERVPGKTTQWILDHVRADKATFTAEIQEAGFRLEGEVAVKGLKENYALKFVRE
jgi:ubiquinone/menaquinone biosynthesis C-methylase UbiE